MQGVEDARFGVRVQGLGGIGVREAPHRCEPSRARESPAQCARAAGLCVHFVTLSTSRARFPAGGHAPGAADGHAQRRGPAEREPAKRLRVAATHSSTTTPSRAAVLTRLLLPDEKTCCTAYA
eukprot:667145-Rhodomonas_salina.2